MFVCMCSSCGYPRRRSSPSIPATVRVNALSRRKITNSHYKRKRKGGGDLGWIHHHLMKDAQKNNKATKELKNTHERGTRSGYKTHQLICIHVNQSVLHLGPDLFILLIPNDLRQQTQTHDHCGVWLIRLAGISSRRVPFQGVHELHDVLSITGEQVAQILELILLNVNRTVSTGRAQAKGRIVPQRDSSMTGQPI